MTQQVRRLTSGQRARIAAHRDAWIGIGLSTEPMFDDDRLAVERAVRTLYRKAGFAEPQRVVFVASPFTMRVASSIAGAALAAYRGGWRGGPIRRSATEQQVGEVVDGTLRDAVDAAFADTIDTYVDETIQHELVRPLFAAIEQTIGEPVEHAIYEATFERPADAVRDAIDAAVTRAAGGTVAYTLGLLQEWAYFEFGGPLRCAWPAWRTYFTQVCGLALAPGIAETLAAIEIIHSRCGPLTLHRDVAMVSERPCVLARDAAGRLHGDSGPAAAWRDGWAMHVWHGLRIPPSHRWIIDAPDRITPDAIEAERNAELRRAMLERFGFASYLKARGARLIAADELHGLPRRLLEIDVAGEKLQVVEVTNGSVEPDGARRTFHLGAARDFRTHAPPGTPAEAIAHSYGIAPKHYREAVRS
jgi:hypothetical protein